MLTTSADIGQYLEKMLSFEVANLSIIYWSVHSSIRMGSVEVTGCMGQIVILASFRFHFIKVPENVVQHTNNNISIMKLISFFLFQFSLRVCVEKICPQHSLIHQETRYKIAIQLFVQSFFQCKFELVSGHTENYV